MLAKDSVILDDDIANSSIDGMECHDQRNAVEIIINSSRLKSRVSTESFHTFSSRGCNAIGISAVVEKFTIRA